jgi:hypothetical protein
MPYVKTTPVAYQWPHQSSCLSNRRSIVSPKIFCALLRGPLCRFVNTSREGQGIERRNLAIPQRSQSLDCPCGAHGEHHQQCLVNGLVFGSLL